MSQRTFMIVCAYLGPLALIPFVAARTDGDAQWHARQGLIMTVAELVAFGGLSVFVGAAVLTRLGVGLVLLAGLWLLWVAVVGLHLAAMITALNGGRFRVPGASAMAEADWAGVVSSMARGVVARVRPR